MRTALLIVALVAQVGFTRQIAEAESHGNPREHERARRVVPIPFQLGRTSDGVGSAFRHLRFPGDSPESQEASAAFLNPWQIGVSFGFASDDMPDAGLTPRIFSWNAPVPNSEGRIGSRGMAIGVKAPFTGCLSIVGGMQYWNFDERQAHWHATQSTLGWSRGTELVDEPMGEDC